MFQVLMKAIIATSGMFQRKVLLDHISYGTALSDLLAVSMVPTSCKSVRTIRYQSLESAYLFSSLNRPDVKVSSSFTLCSHNSFLSLSNMMEKMSNLGRVPTDGC